MLIFKRDGSVAEFDKTKIEKAVLAAFEDVDGEITDYAKQKASNIADYVYEEAEKSPKELDVETIQDAVERGLMACKRKDVAKAFITYRYERNKARERDSQLMKEIEEKLNAKNVQNQNANVDEHSFGGRMGEVNRVVLKKYALDYCMSKMARNNHLNNEIYIHDLDSYAAGSHNCLTIPFDALLANGFNTRQTDIRPAQSLSTAFQLIAVIFQLQSLQQFGGVSASHIDWTMVPYVRKSFYKHFKDGLKYIEDMENAKIFVNPEEVSIEDDGYKEYPRAYKYAMEMTEKELMQAVQGIYHNLNTLQSRSGN